MDGERKQRFRLDRGRLVPIHELAPGKARGSTEFSNRGLGSEYEEVTIWPKRLEYRLTTGGTLHVMGRPNPVKLTNQELDICRILGLEAEELGTFLRNWMPQVEGGAEHTIKRPETLAEFERALWMQGKHRKQMHPETQRRGF